MRARILLLSLVVAALSVAGSPTDFPYVFKRGGDSVTRVNGSVEQFLRIKGRFSGDYIWAKVKGREYLIRDRAVLADAEKVWEPMRELEPAMRAAEARFEPLEKKMDELSDDDHEDHAAEMEALEPKLEAAAREVERLENEMERREEIAEKKFEQIVVRAIDQGKAQQVK